MTTQHLTSLPDIKPDTDDIELTRLAAAGNKSAFELIMRRHNRLLFRTARSILKNDADSEDALQEAYVKAWRALKDFRDDAKLSTWLVRIVVNEALGRVRRQNAAIIPLDSYVHTHSSGDETMDEQQPTHPEFQVTSIQVRQLLESHIDALPDTFRTVFVLRAVQELSVEETAVALQIPEATVRSRFFRARGLLREALAREIDVATANAFAFDGTRCDRIVSKVITLFDQIS
ncbi:MAG TPA: RNA polymerase sigma factor [Steroidobacteraceae bacterium]|jgi:RNA polymerase sigma-70 factor (ECF subfamily)|nr:RNA polymerase sigma factor [Steroidobacteraceae bacterium]